MIRILAAGLEGAVFGSAGPPLRRTADSKLNVEPLNIEMAHAEVGEVDEGLGLGSIPLVSRMSYCMSCLTSYNFATIRLLGGRTPAQTGTSSSAIARTDNCRS